MGIGVVARDSEGACLGWLSRTLANGGSPEVVEAYAAWEALRLAWQWGWPRVIIEGDCASILNKITAETQDRSAVGPLVSDVRSLASHFESVSFSFVRGSCNAVADRLESMAL
ncbi:hypothetical protein Salat_1270900 [Sesamum alatum]|uniref:RNase H type-1 domain-containing protein n=1 Tax=Sesamum alatum TaxID=300844 RepID=A0AAE1YHH3_9LAMI|nr:hypothetical protein Salat_1270900 [Sesamum alatum]